ncbi:hypothetical protein AB833_23935 [Chromatiales bacterium (ex Bugula neritina AB1)]|nr:hypothetical protein AB833_23935 [Chromatiales bacterium (ex Bugula neritina AB1)]
MHLDDQRLLGRQLANARADHELISSTPFESIASLDDAYRVQNQAIAAYGSTQTGYKIGATNPAVQQLFNCNEPFYGPLFDSEHLQGSTGIEQFPGMLGGEAEFAFRCGSDFPDDDLVLTDLPALILACHVAVEIVGRRLQGTGLPPLNSAIADYGVSVAFITGAAISDWQQKDLSAVAVTASSNGEQTNSGTGAAVMGNPLNAILWLHNTLRQHSSGLKAGDWISTGTCLGVIAPVEGVKVDVNFAGCGSLSYQIG